VVAGIPFCLLMSDLLNIEERNELERCEIVIKQGLQTFVEVGQALMLIREKKLYRIEFGTFEDYCNAKWDLTRRHVNRLIGSSEVVAHLGPRGPKPQSEKHARPLTKLEPELQSEVWQEVVERHGEKITHNKVEEVVKEFKPLDNELKLAKKEPMFAQMSEKEILSRAKEISRVKKATKQARFEQRKSEFEKPILVENVNQIIIHGDSLEVLPTLEKKSFDLLLSDPPYGIDFKSGWNNKDKIANDKIKDTVELFENVLREAVPLLKDDAHFYLFGSIDFLPEIKPIVEKYLNLKNILIWDRSVIGMGDLKTYGKSYDIIYFGYNKTFKELNGIRDRDLLKFNRVSPSENVHPTEKPLDILEYLIKKSSKEGDHVLEPFSGSGKTLVACKNTNRKATGVEIEEQYYNLTKSRI
jgi:site-specific DNA-methyltransferase (adenine-specific)